jgi:hypothetical protein
MSERGHGPEATDEPRRDGYDAHDGHASQMLGPIDWPAWGMAILGGALALFVALTLVLAAHP